jgi:predicted RNA-binding Zn-ribbon protein involved in translation (DUF1610 family)
MKRKRKVGTALEDSIDKRKCLYSTTEAEILKLQEQILNYDSEIQKCFGAKMILRRKVLIRKKTEAAGKLLNLQSSDSKKLMHAMMCEIDRLEGSQPKIDRNKKVLHSRLYPPIPNKTSIFDSMSKRDEDKWKNLRGHKKRYSVLFEKPISVRSNNVDVCGTCGVDRIVDKEYARCICPKCGHCKVFASHIFDNREVERDEGTLTRQQSVSHMQKFSAQFEKGYPSTPISVLEDLSIEYSKFHMKDPAKVNSCRTSQLLKNASTVTKLFRKAPDRISKELKAESIPEYSSQELNLLLNQRNRLRLPSEVARDNKYQKKSFNNQIYMRQFGRANGMENSRLFLHAKTVKIHLERCRGLENECELQIDKISQTNSKGVDAHGICWKLQPFS